MSYEGSRKDRTLLHEGISMFALTMTLAAFAARLPYGPLWPSTAAAASLLPSAPRRLPRPAERVPSCQPVASLLPAL